ncbi:hypothetical protein CA952_04280 [Raoultella ornithinolytica]|uniref:EpsG family protein n=1 Tax=Raoultella ornithinolytica TaxID=54291 RepID=UPI000B59D27E|nr:EpsG family protein [Raoultella ornithinolytica]ASI59950.1 hypothetical protein CA210_17645 [Raoultella ornithinolytica]OZV32613.1 hypothetical protein CA956_15420 [Raoultella ornithinolytica]OZV37191.1 hypothetical protein CA952_04280 [Raoultella ornithinolytica]OZV37687.1 hypothetical protein CA954_07450 [Raoultella ornithinolytica]OZV46066.1 hypothetical protein CA957_14845 [Raoultella ornithinolytica]
MTDEYLLRKNQSPLVISFSSVFLLIACAIASPLLAFYLAIILLALINIAETPLRVMIGTVAVLAGSAIYSSRVIGFSTADDFYNTYLPTYSIIAHGGDVFAPYYTGGIEFGLPVYFKLFSPLVTNGDYYIFFYIITAINFFAFYLWVEVYLFKKVVFEKKSLCAACALCFFILSVQSQLMRQTCSTVFILWALAFFDSRKWLKGVLFTGVAAIFHTSAIPIVIIFCIYLYGKKYMKNCMLATLILASVAFISVMDIILKYNLLAAATYKFNFYQTTTIDGLDVSAYWKFLVPLFILSFFFFSKEKEHDKYKSLLRYGTLSYIALMPIPFAADRIMMPMTNYILGVLVFMTLYKVSGPLRGVICLYSVYKFLTLGPLYNGYGVDPFYIWYSYPWYNNLLG